MDNVMVSVVMPAYNCERYIKTSIESVINQTYSNWELIIVIDDSTDDTVNVVDRYNANPQIHYFVNKKNLGVAKSRNRGALLAKGKYIAFLDADDIWMENKLEVQVKLMEDKQAVLSSVARELMDENGTLTGKIMPIQQEITYKKLLCGNTLNTSGVMIKTEVAKEFPMAQDHLHEDYITWLKVLKKYGIAYGISEPLLKYRFMPQTKSGNKLKSAKMTFGVYRAMGFNVFQCIFYFVQYAVNGMKKYT